MSATAVAAPDHYRSGLPGFLRVEILDIEPGRIAGRVELRDALRCEARLLHGGRTTQVWDVTVARESGDRTLAHFRCTQHLLR
jgi:1,4-dihydroxy-2-naphthoyl-CoA hydrolase